MMNNMGQCIQDYWPYKFLIEVPDITPFLARIKLINSGVIATLKSTIVWDDPYTDADEDNPKNFWDSRLEIDPCCKVTLGEATEITIWFKTDKDFLESDAIYFDLPSKFSLVEGNRALSWGHACSVRVLRFSSSWLPKYPEKENDRSKKLVGLCLVLVQMKTLLSEYIHNTVVAVWKEVLVVELIVNSRIVA